MSIGVLDGGLEQAQQDFLKVLQTAKSKEAIDHHLLGTSATTITRMFGRKEVMPWLNTEKEFQKRMEYDTNLVRKYQSWKEGTKETLRSHLSKNKNLAEGIDKTVDDLFERVEKISALASNLNLSKINKKLNGATAAFCFAASASFGGLSIHQHADITNETEVAKTSPGLYLQNRSELSQKFARECMLEHMKEQGVHKEYIKFSDNVVENPHQDASVTLNYDASDSEEALKGCMEGPKIAEHVSSIERNRFNVNALAVGSGVMLAIGVASMYRRRKDVREIENSEREIVSLKTNPFSPVVN